jgi:endo-1,4-beta-xylanase
MLDRMDADGNLVVTREEIEEAVGGQTAQGGSGENGDRGRAVDGLRWVDRSAAPGMTASTFYSGSTGKEVSYAIYLPPGYETDTGRRYPVVFWLHGGRGTQRDAGKFTGIVDAAIRAGKCPAMIIVGVNGLGGRRQGFTGSQYADYKDGSLPMESVIINDLLPHIDQSYRTLGNREGRALEGFSMGGAGALHLSFRHPRLFIATTAIGPALIAPEGGGIVARVYQEGAYKGDEAYWRNYDPETVAETKAGSIRERLFIRLISGEAENSFTYKRTRELSKTLDDLDIEHEFIRPGATGHNYAKVYDAMPQGYEFYTKVFGGLRDESVSGRN